MATKPSTTPEWATGGGAAVLEPLLAEKQLGWVPGSRGPAQWFNWWMRLVYQWMVWLEAFEAEAHTWTQQQTFNGAALLLRNATGGTDGMNVFAVNGRAITASSETNFAIEAGSPAGGIVAEIGAGALPGSFAIRGQTTNPIAPGLNGAALVNGGIAIKAEGGAFTGVKLLEGLATGAGSMGVDVAAELIGVRGTASGASGIGVAGDGLNTGVRGQATAATGVGVRGTGNTTGVGGRFVGGNAASGALAIAGGGNTYGLEGVGSGTGAGVFGLGGASGPGGVFQRGDGNTAGLAALIAGGIDFGDATAPVGTAPVLKQLHAKMGIRAWALVTLNGTATPTVEDRIGVSGVTQATAGTGVVTVTLAQAMASGVFPVVAILMSNNSIVGQTLAFAYGWSFSTTSAIVEIANASAPNTPLAAGATNGYRLFVAVLGAQ
jgi:hypothetical protein